MSRAACQQKVSRRGFQLATIGFSNLEPGGWKRRLIGAETKEIGVDRLADN
jgi:hypothetical protein